MARTAQIPRGRGGISGLMLVLLGAWGGLIPLVGPYFHYGFTPDRTWDLTQGRLDLSVIPGAVAVLAGLLIMLTRSRGIGSFWSIIAALAGFWFIAGAAIIDFFPASVSNSVVVGTPLATSPHRAILTSLGLYAGVGSLILFFAAIALGRFSISPAREHDRLADELGGTAGIAGTGALGYDSYSPAGSAQTYSAAQPPYPGSQDPFGQTQDMYSESQNTVTHGAGSYSPGGDYPTSPTPYQGGQDPYSGGSQDPFAGHDPYSPGQNS
jgi:hypothetical protein